MHKSSLNTTLSFKNLSLQKGTVYFAWIVVLAIENFGNDSEAFICIYNAECHSLCESLFERKLNKRQAAECEGGVFLL